MIVEYLTPEGVTVKRELNQIELTELLKTGGLVLLSVNREPVNRRRRRIPKKKGKG